MALGVPIQTILQAEGMPEWNDVVDWLKTDEVFAIDFEVARKYGATYLADEMLGLVRMLKENPKNAPAVKAAMDVLKWQSAMRDPKFNEKIVVEQKTDGPKDPEQVRAEMDRIKKELKLVK